MLSEEIVLEIDLTLDQLIENAKIAREADLSHLEKNAFKNTQESLLAHLLSMDSMLETKRKSLKVITVEKSRLYDKFKTLKNLNDHFKSSSFKNIKLIKEHQ